MHHDEYPSTKFRLIGGFLVTGFVSVNLDVTCDGTVLDSLS